MFGFTKMFQQLLPLTPMGVREERLLQNYFEHISNFDFDKAKDFVDKEKEVHKGDNRDCLLSWQQMLHTLSQLAIFEKAYMSLGFLEQRWFGRSKDSLRNSYQLVFTELKRVEDTECQTEYPVVGVPSTASEFEILLSHLCGQLAEFIKARLKTIEFYEQISTMGTNKNVNYEDLVNVISEIIQSHSKKFHHPILANIKSGFTFECDIISHLLQAQIMMSESQFLSSLLLLHQAHSKIISWGAGANAREYAKKSVFSNSSKSVSSLPALYQWLLRYKSLLVAKFSFYFYDILSKQTTSAEMKILSAKNTEDFLAKVIAFQKKTDAVNVSLVLDTQGIVYKCAGYQHPDRSFEQPTGLDSFPVIFSYPGEQMFKHRPNVVMMISDRHIEYDKVHYVFDKALPSTYFIINVDVRIFFVVIYETKKSEKDSYVTNFLLELSSVLRCAKHFASLKPGSRVK